MRSVTFVFAVLLLATACGDLTVGQPSAPRSSTLSPSASPVAAQANATCAGFGGPADVVAHHLVIDDLGTGTKRVTSATGGWTVDVPTSWFVTEGAYTGSGSSNATFQSFDPATPGLTPMHPPPGISLVVRPYANAKGASLAAVADEAAHEWPGPSRVLTRDDPVVAGQRSEHRVFAAKSGEGLNYQPGVALWVVPTLRPDLDLVLYAQPAELQQLATADAIVASLRLALPVVPNAISKTRAQVIAKELADPSGTPVAGRRAEAKLVRYRDVASAPQRTVDSGIARLVRDPDELFWLVAVGGPGLGGTAPLHGPYIPFHAILHITPASNDDLSGSWGMGIPDADWPPSFDAVPDLCSPGHSGPSAQAPSCAAAEAGVRGLTSVIVRADRVETKRTNARDLRSVAPQLMAAAIAPDALLCVVAVAGDIRQPNGQIPSPPRNWAVYVSKESSDEAVSAQFGSDGPWPAFFPGLPAR